MNKYEKIRLTCIYLVHHLIFNEAKDLRHSDDKRAEDLKKWVFQYKGDMNPKVIDLYLKRYKKLGVIQLNDLFKEERAKIREAVGDYSWYPTNVTACASCHTGTSSTPIEEIIVQREKYGTFICHNCEYTVDNIENYTFTLLSKNGFYRNEGLTSPDRKLLGFGGSRFVIKHKNGSVTLTNDLIGTRSFHKCFLPRLKDKINCEIICVKDFRPSTLSKILTEEQLIAIQPQIESAGRLGHTIEEDKEVTRRPELIKSVEVVLSKLTNAELDEILIKTVNRL